MNLIDVFYQHDLSTEIDFPRLFELPFINTPSSIIWWLLLWYFWVKYGGPPLILDLRCLMQSVFRNLRVFRYSMLSLRFQKLDTYSSTSLDKHPDSLNTSKKLPETTRRCFGTWELRTQRVHEAAQWGQGIYLVREVFWYGYLCMETPSLAEHSTSLPCRSSALPWWKLW